MKTLFINLAAILTLLMMFFSPFILQCNCGREIHQDGPDHTWTHCVDKTPICQGADKKFAGDGEGVGVFCGKDAFLVKK